MKKMKIIMDSQSICLLLVKLFVILLVESKQVQNKQYLSQYVTNSTVQNFDRDFIKPSSLQGKHPKLSLHVPKCKHQKISRPPTSGISAFQETTLLKFHCSCHSENRRFRGTLSAMMDESLSMVPLHLIRGDSQIAVHIQKCDRLRITVDFAALLMTRPGGAHSNISMKISGAERIYLRRIRLAPSRDHAITVENVSEKVSISGRIDCVGCSSNELQNSKNFKILEDTSMPNIESTDGKSQQKARSRINNQGGIKWPTQFRLNVKSVGILNIEEVRADVPMTLSVRNVNQLLVKHSYFEKIAWPGFYIFNITSVAIKENAFPDIASRSIVAKKGKELVISNNVLDVATAVDIAQFEHVTVRCNRKLISATSLVQSEENCPNTLNVPLLPKLNIFSDFEEREAEITYTDTPPATLVLFAYATTVLGYIWLVAISLIFLLIALYKCFQDKYIAKKSAINNTGEIINNDESKLYEGGHGGIVNKEAVSFPSTKKRNFCQVDERCDGWRYQNDFRNGQYYQDSSFIEEIQCSDERYGHDHSYNLREDRNSNDDIRRWQVYNKGNWHSKGHENFKRDSDYNGSSRCFPICWPCIYREGKSDPSSSVANDLPQSIQGSIVQPDEYSNSSRLHLASSGGPPPDILLQPGLRGEFRPIDQYLVQDGSSVSVRSNRYRNPTYYNEFYGNYRPKSSRSTSHNSRHYRRHKKHRFRDLDELRLMSPSRASQHSSQDPRDYRKQTSQIYGPASLPPPSPLLHAPVQYSNKSHRSHRKKFVPYRNKNHHKHHYDRYRYQYSTPHDETEFDCGHQPRKHNEERGFDIRNRFDEQRRMHFSGSSSYQSDSSFIDRRLKRSSFCSSCDEMETKSCHGSQCSCSFVYSPGAVNSSKGQIQNRMLTNMHEFREVRQNSQVEEDPPLLPPKMSHSNGHEKESLLIKTQIFENQKLQKRDRKSRSRSKHHQIVSSHQQTNYQNDNEQITHPTSNWQHQLDMMSLSKHQNVEIPIDFPIERSPSNQRVFSNLFRDSNEPQIKDNTEFEMASSLYNPCSESKDEKIKQSGYSSSHFQGNRNIVASPNIPKTSSMWSKDPPTAEYGSEPSSIELLAQDLYHDEYSSSESLGTNSFSSYIPGPSLDHGTFAAFTELVDQDKDDEKNKMIPLMKKTSSHVLVLGAKQSPKISKKTKIISTRPKKIDPTNQVLCSEQNDENKDESEAMHISINQIKPVSPLTYSVASVYKQSNLPDSDEGCKPLTRKDIDHGLPSHQNASEDDRLFLEKEKYWNDDTNLFRPPTRRAHLVSTQSSVTDDTENAYR